MELKELVLHEFAVTDALGLFQTEALELVGLVIGVASLEEIDAAVAFVSEDVGTDTANG